MPGGDALRRVPVMEDGEQDQIMGRAVKWTGGGQLGAVLNIFSDQFQIKSYTYSHVY